MGHPNSSPFGEEQRKNHYVTITLPQKEGNIMEVQSRIGIGKTHTGIEKPYSGICCEPCWNAKGKECSCRCGGIFHGEGKVQRGSEPYFTLTEEQAEPFRNLLTVTACLFCGNALSGKPIRAWGEHKGGWNVDPYGMVWLYIHCECGHDWGLNKLGVRK